MTLELRAERANVAAVRYHFGDKLALYAAVLCSATEQMWQASELAVETGEGLPPEETLRSCVRIHLQPVADAGRGSRMHRLIAHELADPTPALPRLVERAIRPGFSSAARSSARCWAATRRTAGSRVASPASRTSACGTHWSCSVRCCPSWGRSGRGPRSRGIS
ncbi:MAG TPA: CerR family C-terminal domain-containing protein [Terriglobia bacterium]|nr:CerR family C-terminal domain-containing protein [Terriglobia bacterium]